MEIYELLWTRKHFILLTGHSTSHFHVEKTLLSISELAEYAFIVGLIAGLEKGLHKGDTVTRDFNDYFILTRARGLFYKTFH